MLLTQLPRTIKLAGIVGIVLTFLLVLRISGGGQLSLPVVGTAEANSSSDLAGDESGKGGSSLGDSSSSLPCQRLPGVEDVVVVMRTGASEIKDKLPVGYVVGDRLDLWSMLILCVLDS